jgi:hypothetical protein
MMVALPGAPDRARPIAMTDPFMMDHQRHRAPKGCSGQPAARVTRRRRAFPLRIVLAPGASLASARHRRTCSAGAGRRSVVGTDRPWAAERTRSYGSACDRSRRSRGPACAAPARAPLRQALGRRRPSRAACARSPDRRSRRGTRSCRCNRRCARQAVRPLRPARRPCGQATQGACYPLARMPAAGPGRS